VRRTIVTWVVLAVLGVVLAAGLTLATSHIVGQHIGLSSEPGSAGDHLAAPARTETTPERTETTPERTVTTPPRTVTVPGPTITAPAPTGGDDGGGSGDD
jgi:hypothetical protein